MKFQNGKLSAFTKENTSFTRLKDEDGKSSALVVANGQTYQGHVNDLMANELTDNYVVVRNKTTNKVNKSKFLAKTLFLIIYN